ncbi:PREDICTED: melatonin receptor type 1C-like, partial [Priapulus caudatus]|uniref:Melatonin receptor type 1C-like n=1 Tax=Priapulus caudatus TaxID=37621 RepID=A0ABM1F0K1_PRICU
MVIMAILKEKKLRSTGNMFVVNLTISDLGISMFVDPMAIVGIAGGYEFFYNKTPLCVTIATVCLVCCIASLLNITAISVNRYVVMCHTAIYNTIFTWPSTFVYCGLIWIASILIEIPTHFGWGNNKYDFKGLACLYDRTYDVSYTAFFAISSIVIPLFIVIFCYTRIYFFVRNSRRRIAASAPDALMSQQRTRDELKLAKTLFVTCFVFFIFWGMYGITVVFGNAWPMEWHALSLQIAHSSYWSRTARRGFARHSGMAAAVATNTSTVATSGNETEDGWETRMVEFLKPLAEYPGFCWFLVVLLTAMTAFGTFGNIM